MITEKVCLTVSDPPFMKGGNAENTFLANWTVVSLVFLAFVPFTLE